MHISVGCVRLPWSDLGGNDGFSLFASPCTPFGVFVGPAVTDCKTEMTNVDDSFYY